ncbi:uncharacterized protein LOC131145170 isoform X2 [Malania oleifera]|uniref:uncharacterized protein LOC131145170 isoform X2 n=1 Tax=Malania oleifera TaxID=397392 RepID=UPI0025ADDBEF|nr:uncharacterized protein LOC131145170 isoform X2 [Malania oleifera]
MILNSSPLTSVVPRARKRRCSPSKTSRSVITPRAYVNARSELRGFSRKQKESHSQSSPPELQSHCACPLCSTGRRRLLEAVVTTLFPNFASNASDLGSDYTAMLNKVHPPRPDWYEEFYASVLNNGMKSYEAEIAGYKSQLFATLRGKVENVLEIGIGTGPNLKYYAGDTGVHVIGIDPNKKMEKYALASAADVGLPLTNFKFIQSVGEALPLSDASVDAVVGTLVLCSVKDVDMTLKGIKVSGAFVFLGHCQLWLFGKIRVSEEQGLSYELRGEEGS